MLSELYDKALVNDKLLIQEKSSFNKCKDYLRKIKEIFNLPNDVENNAEGKKSLLSIVQKDNYVITKDIIKKMVLIYYRIKANIPIILMGEAGCGKTSLIIKLNQILNNGETLLKKININPFTSNKDIYEKMKEIDNEAKNKKEKEILIFFDEMNTCLSLSILTEIFINRSYNGEKFSENIRLIGACYPYREKKKDKDIYELDKKDNNNDNILAYLVQPLPQSLLHYVFIFGTTNENDEMEYFYNGIKKFFEDDENYLLTITVDTIIKCQNYLKAILDPSIVSLREISIFSKCFEFFQKYYSIKYEYENETRKNKENNRGKNDIKFDKIKSIICSIYICYYIRLPDENKRNCLDYEIKPLLLKLIN